MGENYDLAYFQDGANYLIRITPKAANVKKFAEQVDLYVDALDFSVVKMKMVEPIKKGQKKNDYTEYSFNNRKNNAPIAETVFAIK